MRHILILLILSLICPALCANKERTTISSWQIVAGADPFTDEEWFLIAPVLPPKGDALNSSVYLRPCIVYDNGVFLVGSTTFGRIELSHGIVLPSIVGPRDILFRVDKQPFKELFVKDNPKRQINLPGYCIAHDKPAIPSEMPPEFAAAISQSAEKGGNYVLIEGGSAELLVDELLSGTKVVIRRKSETLYSSMEPSFSALKEFSAGAPIREAFAKIGLQKNTTTGKWELDPAKKAAREALIESSKPLLTESARK